METSDVLSTLALVVAVVSLAYTAWSSRSFRAQDDLKAMRHVAVSSLTTFYHGLGRYIYENQERADSERDAIATGMDDSYARARDQDMGTSATVAALTDMSDSYARARDTYRMYRHRISGANQQTLDRLVNDAGDRASDYQRTSSAEARALTIMAYKEFLEELNDVVLPQ